MEILFRIEIRCHKIGELNTGEWVDYDDKYETGTSTICCSPFYLQVFFPANILFQIHTNFDVSFLLFL